MALIHDIALTLMEQVGPATIITLLNRFGSAEEVMNAGFENLTAKGFSNHISKKITGQIQSGIIKATAHLEHCEKYGITPITSYSPLYPPLLRECNDYPHVLYYMGNTELLQADMLAMVGTRQMTPYGNKLCNTLIHGLAERKKDLVIVSGLAYGTDSECHRAAMANELPTIAVIPTRLPKIYPAGHDALARNILKSGGGLLSEYAYDNSSKVKNFRERNRIIAGMSSGTVIVECEMKSGSMMTANLAHGYNRCLMAVPGRVGDPYSAGCNYLISKNKAAMVCSAEDIAAEMMWDVVRMAEPKISTTINENANPNAAIIIGLLSDGNDMGIDELSLKSGLTIAELSTLLFELECSNVIKSLPGKCYGKL